MAPQSDLEKIGKEAFDIVDRFFPRKSRSRPHQIPPPPQRNPAPPATTNFPANHQEDFHLHYHPQGSYLRYLPQGSNTVLRANKALATEATVVYSYHYEAAVKPLGNILVMEYQRPSFHYN